MTTALRLIRSRWNTVIGLVVLLTAATAGSGGGGQNGLEREKSFGNAPNVPPDPVVHRVASLKARIRIIDRQISGLQQQLPVLEKQLDNLIDRVGMVRLPDPDEKPQPTTKAPPRKVPFRPPIERKVHKKTPIVLICEEGRVGILDVEMMNRELKKTLKSEAAMKQFVENKGGTFDAGDFVVRLDIVVLGNFVMIQQEAIRKSGHPGEPLQEALKADSKLNTRLAALRRQASQSVVQFLVYPDSYDIFRAVRQTVWVMKFSVNWGPMAHGEKIIIGEAGQEGVSVL